MPGKVGCACDFAVCEDGSSVHEVVAERPALGNLASDLEGVGVGVGVWRSVLEGVGVARGVESMEEDSQSAS